MLFLKHTPLAASIKKVISPPQDPTADDAIPECSLLETIPKGSFLGTASPLVKVFFYPFNGLDMVQMESM